MTKRKTLIMPAFLPCPFCGCKRVKLSPTTHEEENAMVMCLARGCGARIYLPDDQKACAAWNKRKWSHDDAL